MQLLGTLESEQLTFFTMLCIDIDKPDEYMIHVWGNDKKPFALMCERQRLDGGIDRIAPRSLFAVGDKGGIFPTEVSEDDRNAFNSTQAHLRWTSDDIYEGDWSGADGKRGRITFRINRPAPVRAVECSTWAQFHEWSNMMRREKNATYFRGHGSNQFHLETTLQRSGRHRLERYCAETLQKFHRHAEAVLNLKINMNDGDDYSMLLGLAQHHGLPTPLLDWSASPYVAAFFAFADALENTSTRRDVEKVRIFALAAAFVHMHSSPFVILPYFGPYVSPLEISFRNNPRLYAQQGCFIATNNWNLSGGIMQVESASKTEFLFAADLPVGLASEALQNLAFMGVSAATLFPGLEGISRMLKHEMAFGNSTPEINVHPAQDLPTVVD